MVAFKAGLGPLVCDWRTPEEFGNGVLPLCGWRRAGGREFLNWTENMIDTPLPDGATLIETSHVSFDRFLVRALPPSWCVGAAAARGMGADVFAAETQTLFRIPAGESLPAILRAAYRRLSEGRARSMAHAVLCECGALSEGDAGTVDLLREVEDRPAEDPGSPLPADLCGARR